MSSRPRRGAGRGWTEDDEAPRRGHLLLSASHWMSTLRLWQASPFCVRHEHRRAKLRLFKLTQTGLSVIARLLTSKNNLIVNRAQF